MVRFDIYEWYADANPMNESHEIFFIPSLTKLQRFANTHMQSLNDGQKYAVDVLLHPERYRVSQSLGKRGHCHHMIPKKLRVSPTDTRNLIDFDEEIHFLFRICLSALFDHDPLHLAVNMMSNGCGVSWNKQTYEDALLNANVEGSVIKKVGEAMKEATKAHECCLSCNLSCTRCGRY